MDNGVPDQFAKVKKLHEIVVKAHRVLFCTVCVCVYGPLTNDDDP